MNRNASIMTTALALALLCAGCKASWFAHPLGGKVEQPDRMTWQQCDTNHFNQPDASRLPAANRMTLAAAVVNPWPARSIEWREDPFRWVPVRHVSIGTDATSFQNFQTVNNPLPIRETVTAGVYRCENVTITNRVTVPGAPALFVKVE